MKKKVVGILVAVIAVVACVVWYFGPQRVLNTVGICYAGQDSVAVVDTVNPSKVDTVVLTDTIVQIQVDTIEVESESTENLKNIIEHQNQMIRNQNK